MDQFQNYDKLVINGIHKNRRMSCIHIGTLSILSTPFSLSLSLSLSFLLFPLPFLFPFSLLKNADDLSKAYVAAAQKITQAKGRIFNIVNGYDHPLYSEVALKSAQLAGYKGTS